MGAFVWKRDSSDSSSQPPATTHAATRPPATLTSAHPTKTSGLHPEVPSSHPGANKPHKSLAAPPIPGQVTHQIKQGRIASIRSADASGAHAVPGPSGTKRGASAVERQEPKRLRPSPQTKPPQERAANSTARAIPSANASSSLSREESERMLREREKEIEALRLKLKQSESLVAASGLAQRSHEVKESQEQLRKQAELGRKRDQLARELGSITSLSVETDGKDKDGTKRGLVSTIGDKSSGSIAADEVNAEIEAEIDRVLGSRNDYYVLNVPIGSNLSRVKAGYRRLAIMLHPDKCKMAGAGEAFQKVNASHINLCKVLQHE